MYEHMGQYLKFDDKVVIVTGASSGIGAQTAKHLAKFGAKLALVARNEERLMAVAIACEEYRNNKPLCFTLDLTQDGKCEAVVSKTVEVFGKINVLVNCAGDGFISSVFDKSIKIFDDSMAIHLRVPFLLTQLVIPYLLKTKGNVVNVSFSMTRRFRPGFMVCIMSKIALEAFTKMAAPELMLEGVRINCVSPGFTRTNILSGLNMASSGQEGFYEGLNSMLPCGKVLDPNEVAACICLVASDVFPRMNGACLVIDGAASLV